MVNIQSRIILNDKGYKLSLKEWLLSNRNSWTKSQSSLAPTVPLALKLDQIVRVQPLPMFYNAKRYFPDILPLVKSN